MKNLHFGKREDTKWFMGKGFYISLAVSLVAIGVASYIAVDRTMNSLRNQEDNGQNIINAVDNTQSGVPYSSSSSSSSAKGAASVKSSSSGQASSASSSSSSSSTPKQEVSKQNLLFSMPLKGDILNNFSNSELVKSKTLGDWRTHDGVDIKSEVGTPVKSIAAGKVIDIQEDALWGVVVVVEHADGYTSHYSGLNKTVDVKVGQTIAIGDVLGTLGETSQIEISEESHLHLGVKKGEDWIDPMSIIENP